LGVGENLRPGLNGIVTLRFRLLPRFYNLRKSETGFKRDCDEE